MNSQSQSVNFSEAQARTQASYDQFPYISKAFAQTHPTRLAAIGRIFGLDTPSMETARILEIGCASGGNIIPIAAAYPNANILGVDFSITQVNDGNRRIENLGLSNIEIRQQDITFFKGPGYKFDYIICHGVFSWVSDPVRESILYVCSKYLQPEGVAYISYNVLPGWRPKQIVRDALLAHVGHLTDPSERIVKSRAFVASLRESAPASAYGSALNEVIASLDDAGDDYFLHEYLETENVPFTFPDFVAKAGKHDLSYLAESDLNLMFPENVGSVAATSIRSLASNNLLDVEKYIDVFTGRTFRQTLLVHAAQAVKIKRIVEHERIADLHLLGDLEVTSSNDPRFPYCFRGRERGEFKTRIEAVKRAFDLLTARQPASSNYRQLIAALENTGRKTSPEDRAEILAALSQAVLAGVLIAVSVPVKVGKQGNAMPRAIELARREAEIGHTRTTNLRHENHDLGIVAQHILPLLDGKHDSNTLLAHVITKAREGAIRFDRDGKRVEDEEGIAECAREHVAMTISDLWRHAMIE